MPRPPSIQWYYKQYLGDNKVLAMDWDARGMHVHLLMLSIQEEPPGTIPADDAAIRRWLSLPLGSVDADQTWRRVKSQLLAAWQPEGERLMNLGMMESCGRQERYRNRYEIGTKKPPNPNAVEEEKLLILEVEDQKQLQQQRRDRTGTRLPDGFKVSTAIRAWAAQEHLPDPDLHIAEFIDYWTAIPGHKGVKLDWDATFRNWLRRSQQFKGGSRDGHTQTAGRGNGVSGGTVAPPRVSTQAQRAFSNIAAVATVLRGSNRVVTEERGPAMADRSLTVGAGQKA